MHGDGSLAPFVGRKNRPCESAGIRNCYLRLRERRGHKRVIIAIARMLLTAIYNILKKKEAYNAELYIKSDVLPVTREVTVEQAILLAKNHCYHVLDAS